MTSDSHVVRIAAVGDLHCTKTAQGQFQPIFAQVAGRADVLLLCGDLTDFGHADEARVLVRELIGVGVPVLAVLGNHDHESGKADEVTAVLDEAGITVLDGGMREVRGVAFVGVKGFGGGFGRRMLEPWGEPTLKAFVQESVDETMKLEKALSRVRGMPRVVLMHYAPIRDTVDSEHAEILPFLGSSRLEEPLNRFRVSMAFHGHAHRGSTDGATSTGVPVYNVAMPLLRRTFRADPPFRVVELNVEERSQGLGHEQEAQGDESATIGRIVGRAGVDVAEAAVETR
ncbi:MAG TPA: metallophosphoesterase [Kofleriaceae bacterium]|nr:metallophosphoesterase [Kofleriaceae bacterium]